MARFYTLQIGSVYMTSTGASDGRPLRLRIDGLGALRTSYAGVTRSGADGTPYTTAINNGTKGRPLSVRIDFLPAAVFELLVTAINNAIAGNTTITLVGAGDLGEIDLAAVPAMPEPIQASGEFSGSILRDVTLNFVTAS